MRRDGHENVAAGGGGHAYNSAYSGGATRDDWIATVIKGRGKDLDAKVGFLLVEQTRHAGGIVECWSVDSRCAGLTQVCCETIDATLDGIKRTVRR